MASKKLTVGLKKDIQRNIKNHVEQAMAESGPGKELQDLKNKISAWLRAELTSTFSKNEIAVLKKFSCAESQTWVNLIVSNKGTVLSGWGGTRNALETEFAPALETPGTGKYSRIHMATLIEGDKDAKQLVVAASKFNNHVLCETKESIKALMDIVNNYNTTKQLLDAYPKMAKFMPVEVTKPKSIPARSKAVAAGLGV